MKLASSIVFILIAALSMPSCAERGSVDSPDAKTSTTKDTKTSVSDTKTKTAKDVTSSTDNGPASNDASGITPTADAVPTEDTAQPDNSTGEHEITTCANLGSGDQSCYWNYRFDPDKCESQGCKKLAIYFSGGTMTCPDPADDSSYLGKLSSLGYVTVCARLYENADGSAEFPYFEEAGRVDVLMESITSDKAISEAWSGDYLLITGGSHGATAPVVAMARTGLDEKPSWKGTKLTGACFFDGMYDAQAALKLLHENQCTSPVSYERVYSRYCDWPQTAQSPETWPAPGECQPDSLILDTVVNSDATEFAIKHWKLIECGSSALDKCVSDIFPAEPIELLCKRINADDDASCEYKPFPSSSHATCGITLTNAGACWQWFNQLIQSQ